ncbi:spore germination protein [Metabacillus fastidiosus]|uniref:spore germination protein n=1 Tax=Metabacillus fastidiosus TaxID=1458 RepID=UPI002DBA9CB8|nr:spore germination protein [Metabacillus fastidiosus]MEC2078546.1 spore germination protein [Metabacillus fastidiosus]
MGFLKKGSKPVKSKHSKVNLNNEQKKQPQSDPLSLDLKENIQKVKQTLGNSDDIVIREIRIGKKKTIEAGIIYTDGLIDSASVQDFIMESLMLDLPQIETDEVNLEDFLLQLKETVLTVGEISDVYDYNSLFDSLLTGHVILLFKGITKGFAIGMKGGKERSISEPTTENAIRGPREALTENIRTNTALIRRKINNPNLWVETKKIGKETKTTVSFMYIKGIVNDKIVDEVRNRLDRINIDSILESGYIEELIQDKTYTPFPTIYNSERPDVIAAYLLEGRVAVLIDGTPFVLTVPALFVEFLHAPDDYYNRSDITTLIRFLRYVGLFVALLGPSLYIAITTFHQEMLPTPLLINLAAQREGVPFPAFIEAVIMEVTFEILRESGLRLPKAVGQAVSVVGTLVIGTAAVDAGIVSAAMVIVVSVTAISSFIVSSYQLSISIRMLRFPFMALAASFGLFGIIVGLIALTLHLCSLRSFGVPYMAPFAPFILEDQKDAIFRLPRWALFARPRLVNQKNVKREDTVSPKPKS